MIADDLSGRWQGIFNYPRDQPATGFAAILTDAAGTLSGETIEPGLSGGEVAARLDGRRDGSVVTFVKVYDASDGDYDSVAYEGTVAADGQEITGRWTIPGIWSGTFIMVREAGVAVPDEVAARDEVDAGLDAPSERLHQSAARSAWQQPFERQQAERRDRRGVADRAVGQHA